MLYCTYKQNQSAYGGNEYENFNDDDRLPIPLHTQQNPERRIPNIEPKRRDSDAVFANMILSGKLPCGEAFLLYGHLACRFRHLTGKGLHY